MPWRLVTEQRVLDAMEEHSEPRLSSWSVVLRARRLILFVKATCSVGDHLQITVLKPPMCGRNARG